MSSPLIRISLGGTNVFRTVLCLMLTSWPALAADLATTVQQRNQHYAEALEGTLRDFLVEGYTARAAASWTRSYENVSAFLKSVEPEQGTIPPLCFSSGSKTDRSSGASAIRQLAGNPGRVDQYSVRENTRRGTVGIAGSIVRAGASGNCPARHRQLSRKGFWAGKMQPRNPCTRLRPCALA